MLLVLQTSGIEFGKKLRRRKVEEGRGGDPGQSLVACRYMMDLLKLSHEGEKETVGGLVAVACNCVT